jgi:hypothetical protein
MIKELLTMLFIKRASLNEVATELKISLDDLQGRLHMMQHLGYVTKVNIASTKCDANCMGCTSKPTKSPEVPRVGNILCGFELTDKGRKVIKG